MPRFDDRSGSTRLYVGHLSSRSRSHDLEDLFGRYGRVRGVDMKHDFAFIDFSDPRDADDARYSLNGRDFGGSRIVVEFARGGPRGRGGSREHLGRAPPPGSGRCFNCGIDGHWARDCKAGDCKNKCYRCGERGHVERNCKNSPTSIRRGRSYSRSPSPRRGRSQSRSYSRSGSYSRSRSPPRRGGRSVEREERSRSRSPGYSRSPPPSKGRKRSPPPEGSRSPPPSKGRKRSPSPDGSRSPPEQVSPSPKGRLQTERNGESPGRENSRRSPMSQEQESPAARQRYRSPSAGDDEPGDKQASPRGSESP